MWITPTTYSQKQIRLLPDLSARFSVARKVENISETFQLISSVFRRSANIKFAPPSRMALGFENARTS